MSVESDRRDVKDVDVGRQTEKYIATGIVGSSAMALVTYYVLLQLSVEFLPRLFAVGFIVSIPMVWALSRSRTKLNMMHAGYDVDWSIDFDWTKPVGVEQLDLVRVDNGLGGGVIGGYSTNPFVTSKRTIQSRVKEQHNLVCTECGTEPFKQRMDLRRGAYFIETRRRYWLCFVPIYSEIRNTECLCADHRPHELLE
jgi:hypothetical protein